MATLITPTGRTLDVTVDGPDEAGRVFYTVARVGGTKVGTFTIGPDDTHIDGEGGVCVSYGRAPLRHHGRGDLPEAPVLFGVTLAGLAVFRPSSMRAARYPSSWLVCRRTVDQHRTAYVPEGTHARAADIVRALVEDWEARDDNDALWAAHVRHLAPGRLASLTRRADDLRRDIAKLQSELAQVLAEADVQAALIDPGAAP